ncbi:MAG: hypothetical protein K1X78_01980 [Verrucomicrobiaceae bacterium]|nr:hypothetical protein [Verrucomicrobiaceae bacterium]
MNTKPPSIISCIAVLSLLVLAGCREDQAQIDRLQNEIRTLTDQQTSTQSEINRLKMQINSLGKERDGLKEETGRMEKELESARRTLEQLQKDYASYRSQYKLSMRSRASGMKLGDLVVDGKSYTDVVVKEATEEILSTIHSSGPKKFPWADLPDTVRKLFGIEKPGEYRTISFTRQTSEAAPLSIDEAIRRHDAEMLELQQGIANREADEAKIRKARSEAVSTLSMAKARGVDSGALARTVNVYDMKITTLEAEIRTLRTKQKELIAKDPRRTRVKIP